MALTQEEKDGIVAALINIDDPFYLNTFENAEDEEEWFDINEKKLFDDMKNYLPDLDLDNRENWAFVRKCFSQF